MAQAKECQQVLWLPDNERYIKEVDAMNVFMCLKNKNSDTILVTPSLNGLILPVSLIKVFWILDGHG